MNSAVELSEGLVLKDLKIVEWKALFDDLPPEDFLEISKNESKKGVLQLRKRAYSILEKQALLLEAWHKRNQPKKKLQAKGALLIGGADEAGRGPLAGPVVAGVVVLAAPILGLRDSKKISEKKREELYHIIKKEALGYGVGWADQKEIDKLNILNATKLAMQRAIKKLGFSLDALLLDGTPMDLHPMEWALIGGDDLSNEIAAASILAKVTRDHWMMEMDKHFPVYGFAQHKGYGTAQHIEALREFGPCHLHRKSFLSFLNDNLK